jgi:hypothetical protein
MRNRRPGSIADRIFCAKSHCRFHIQPLPPQRGRVRFVGAPTGKIGFRYGGPPGIAFGRPADQPAGMRIDRRMALAAFGSMAATIAVMLVITVWGYMS